MNRKAKSGSRRRCDTEKYRKHHRKQLGKRVEKEEREIKRQAARLHTEAEFAQRIKEEPGLATLLDRVSPKEGE